MHVLLHEGCAKDYVYRNSIMYTENMTREIQFDYYLLFAVPPEVSPTDGVTSKLTSAEDPVTVSFFVANEPVPNVTKEGIHWVFTGIGGAVNLSCTNTSKYSFSDNCLSLTVSNAEGSDAGLYQITVTTEAGIGMSAVEITVRKSE